MDVDYLPQFLTGGAAAGRGESECCARINAPRHFAACRWVSAGHAFSHTWGVSLSPAYRRIGTLLFLLAYVAAATGLPVVVPPTKLASSDRFPCEGCPCGCSSAQHCWTQCRCQTLRERLSWAARENVRPPQAALVAAQRAGLDVGLWLPTAPTPDEPPQGHKTVKAQGSAKCCHCCMAEEAAPAPPADDSPTPEPSWRTLVCGGGLQLWLTLGVALPIEAPPVLGTQRLGFTTPVAPSCWLCHSQVPPTPPPELRG